MTDDDPMLDLLAALRPDMMDRPREWISDSLRHLSIAELSLATRHLGMDVRKIGEGSRPSAMLLGECPGEHTHPDLPMFPWPLTSSAGRLMQMSGLTVEEYLGGLVRRNLLNEREWDDKLAKRHADFLTTSLPGSPIKRLVICGDKAQRAFGRGFAKWMPFSLTNATLSGVTAVIIPHPSGLNRIYNDVDARQKTARWLHWAVYGGLV